MENVPYNHPPVEHLTIKNEVPGSTGIDPATLALLGGNNGGFGGRGGVAEMLVLLAALRGNGLFGANGASVADPVVAGLSQQIETVGTTLVHMQQGQAGEHRIDALETTMNGRFAEAAVESATVQRSIADILREQAKCCCETQLAIKETQYQQALTEGRMNAQFCALDRSLSDKLAAHEAADVARHTESVVAAKDAENRQLRDLLLASSQQQQTATIIAALSRGNGNNGNGNGHGGGGS